jgi:hypothetical protein
MSDRPLDLDLVRIGMGIGMACVIAAVVTVGAFFVIRILAEAG